MRKFFVYAFSFIFSLIGNEVYAKSINQDAGFSIGDIELVSAKLNIPEITQDGKLFDIELQSIRTFLEERNYRVDTVTSVGTFSLLLNQYERNIGKIVPDIYSFSQIQLLLFDLGVIAESDVWNNTTQQKVADYLKRGGAIYNSGELNAENVSTLLNDYFINHGTSKSIVNHHGSKQIQRVQKLLIELGFDPGPIDGLFGAKTYSALFQALKEYSLEPESSSSAFEPRDLNLISSLVARRTINPFRAWHLGEGTKDYALFWGYNAPKRYDALSLVTPTWNYYYPSSGGYEGIERFLRRGAWDHDAEYGETLPVDYRSESFRNWFINEVGRQINANEADGVMLDWWHDWHMDSNGFSSNEVQRSRHALAAALRKSFGENFIVMGNVNWGENTDVVNLNGVFMELNKDNAARVYSSSELQKIEKALWKIEKELLPPKLIALEGWRSTRVKMGNRRYSSEINDDRNSPENRQIAKLLTAMSVVIPSNGYILYGDNNQDTTNGDHAHTLYDFYDFDVGKPISAPKRLFSGVAFKEHQRGIVAYNITSRDHNFEVQNINFTVKAKSGLFCEISKSKPYCLNNN